MASVNIYPNPASESIVVDYDYKHRPQSFKVINTIGKRVIENNFSNEIDISGLSPGVYILQLNFNVTSVIKRFVKL